jgi:hypothetical protein
MSKYLPGLRFKNTIFRLAKPGRPDVPAIIRTTKEQGLRSLASLPHFYAYEDGAKAIVGPGICWQWERDHLRLYWIEPTVIGMDDKGMAIEGRVVELFTTGP